MEALDLAVAQLPPESQRIFQQEYNRKAKSMLVAYLCWFFGLHYLYVGKIGTQVVFWLTLGGLGFWWMFDALRLFGVISESNRDAKANALAVTKAIAA